MARYIHCEKCNREMAASAKEFGELYESLPGYPIGDLRCDGCGMSFFPDDKCYAAVLLTSNSHPNYKYHTPEAWDERFFNHRTSKENDPEYKYQVLDQKKFAEAIVFELENSKSFLMEMMM